MGFSAIFDFDGVIIDSSWHHEKSWQLLAQEEDHVLPGGFFKKSFGMKNEQIIPSMLGWTKDIKEVKRLSDRKEELYRQLLAENGLNSLPGARLLLKELKDHNILCAIGSSTPRKNLATALDLLDMEHYFSALVSSEDVVHGKPSPEVFIKAAEILSENPETCVVFEDAHVGIAAAKAAGMKAVALTTTHPAGSFTDADLIIKDLSEITLKDIKELFLEEKI